MKKVRAAAGFLMAALLLAAAYETVIVKAFDAGHSGAVQTYRNEDVLSIAHRGASGYAPENTIAAFDKAVSMHADMIELDVQLSKEQIPVVIHDSRVDRTTNGQGAVNRLTLEELKKLDAGSWFDNSFSKEQIPALDEVLERYGGKTPLLIELKSPDMNRGIEQITARLLKKHGLDRNQGLRHMIIVQSFNRDSLMRFHALLPEVPVGVLVDNPFDLTKSQFERYSAYAEYINPPFWMIGEEMVRSAHTTGLKVFAWSVRDLTDVPRLMNLEVDGIITDFPDYVPTDVL